jgi:hypothetical protein
VVHYAHMDQNQTKPKSSAKDFFINLGAIIALGIVVGYLLDLLFTIIDKAYPVINSYSYYGSYSISWPVSTLIIFFPIYILLMWLLEHDYRTEPERRHVGVRKWLTYITLFFAGLSIAGDLVTVIYYFIDGQELTTGFILKALSILVVALGVFFYYISDLMNKINSTSRNVWAIVSSLIILGAIIWGFSVLGSPRTQQLYKYDEQKVSDLQNIDGLITNYWQLQNKLPNSLEESVSVLNTRPYTIVTDRQTQKSYEYKKTGDKTYELCAEFNRQGSSGGDFSYIWDHPIGHHCFTRTVTKR